MRIYEMSKAPHSLVLAAVIVNLRNQPSITVGDLARKGNATGCASGDSENGDRLCQGTLPVITMAYSYANFIQVLAVSEINETNI